MIEDDDVGSIYAVNSLSNWNTQWDLLSQFRLQSFFDTITSDNKNSVLDDKLI